MTQRTMPVRFLRSVASAAEHRGVDLDEWLAQLEIDPDLLFEERGRITLQQASSLVRALWKLTGDELVGLGPQPAPNGTFRMLSLALLSSPDLATVLGRLQDFSRVLPGFPAVEVEVGESRTRLRLGLDPADDPGHFVADLVLSLSLRFASWLAGTRLPVERVDLPYPLPEQAEDYDLVFGGRIEFGQPVAGIVFSNQVLDLPVMRTEEELEQWLADAPADLLMYRDYGMTAADQVRRILERGLQGAWPTPDEIASQLAMSTQHLRRVLREQGTSMSTIKEDLLRDAAIASLVRGEESVAELAARLGFSEPSAFHRAFRRWTGSAPGSYRPRAASGD